MRVSPSMEGYMTKIASNTVFARVWLSFKGAGLSEKGAGLILKGRGLALKGRGLFKKGAGLSSKGWGLFVGVLLIPCFAIIIIELGCILKKARNDMNSFLEH